MAIGAVSDLEAIAEELARGSEAEAGAGAAPGAARGQLRLRRRARSGRVARRRARDDAMSADVDDRRRPCRRRPSWWWTTAPPTCRCSSARCTAAVTASWSPGTAPTALEIARRATPDLVLLDVMMPVMDGFEVCRALKAQPETRDAAVIFMSARGEVSDKVSGLELGAVDYITKPIQAEEVLARVAAHLSRQHLERALRESRDRLDRELAGAARMQRFDPAGRDARRIRPSALPRTTRRAAMPAATTTTCSRSAAIDSASWSPTCPATARRPRSSWR